MSPQLLEDLAVPPARGHRPVSWLEVTYGLRPLSRRRRASDLVGLWLSVDVVGGWRVGGRRVCGRKLLLLRGPVVNVPVVLVKDAVVLIEQLGGQRGQVSGREGREEKIGLKSSTLSGLVYSGMC